MLEDDITEYTRMRKRDERIAALEAALSSCVAAMRDVQDHWGDPGSWMHNRLETPLLVHSETIALEPSKINREQREEIQRRNAHILLAEIERRRMFWDALRELAEPKP